MINQPPNGMMNTPIRFLFLLLIGIFASGAQTTQAQQAKASASTNGISWYSAEKAQQLAKKHHKKVLIYSEAEWCVYCQKMNNKVFPEQAVIDSLNAYFYPVRIDIESSDSLTFNGERMTKRQFAGKYQVRATPTTFFVDSDGSILGSQPGFIPAQTFSQLLAFVGSGAFKQMEFKKYMQLHGSSTQE